MYTDPQLYNPKDGAKRGFISFYFKGKRYRFYNGKAIGIECYPNCNETPKERERLFKHLLREYTRALLNGWTPESSASINAPEAKTLPLGVLFDQLNKNLQDSSYSKTYKRDIISVTKQFSEFLFSENREGVLPHDIASADIERFLQQFSSSGTYYQNKRRNLVAVFSKLVKQGYCSSNPALETSKRKSKAVRHQAYTPAQLALLLSYLKENNPNLYLCALLMYGTLLRPHQEIRLLKRRHFNQDMTQFYLDGYENKSGRIRSLTVPLYVREALIERKVNELEPEQNIFTGSKVAFNDCYFNTKWGRLKPKFLQLGLIQHNQTLYSFRHAASINVFNKTQNLKLLQQLFDHSSLNTSLIYLRSIGVVQVSDSEMPELGFEI
ncbi:tyrosine-type recombinase/integrase [Rufibacter latericius]|uniref:Integrase n=1 Tax=Rufibacter latericius TaxID=2487040 RepID=A0A3M9MNZ7_9BACT|nr:site-specific integrase [Rufibacter latericius]RNI26917.1 integrase [Rufibacter latericius]